MDKFVAGTIMTAFSVMGGIGAMFFARSAGISGLICGRIFLGIGMSCNLMGSLKLFTEWFSPGEFATLSGFILAVGTLGNMMATFPLVLLISSIGWRASFFIIGIITILLSACFFTVIRDNPEGLKSNLHKNRIKKAQTTLLYLIKTVFSNPNYWAISGGGCSDMVGYLCSCSGLMGWPLSYDHTSYIAHSYWKPFLYPQHRIYSRLSNWWISV